MRHLICDVSINENNSPLRRLRNRNIYSNITLKENGLSSSKENEAICELNSINNSANNNVSIENSLLLSNESKERSSEDNDFLDNANENVLINYSSDSDVSQDVEAETTNKKLILTKTQRGCPKLYHNGYFYTIDGCSKRQVGPYEKVYWKCERTGSKSVPKCFGRAFSIYYYEPVVVSVLHNHESNPEKLPCLQTVEEIKKRAEISNDNPRTIINTCQIGINEESSKDMIRNINLTQMIHRIRNKRPEYQANANNIMEIGSTIPPTLKITYRNEPFYLGKCIYF